jgi:Tol biopolymer transport system component
MKAFRSERIYPLRMSMVALAAIVAAFLLALTVRVEPSHATFPGQNGKIAFTRDTDIYTMNADGSQVTNLTTGPGWETSGFAHEENYEPVWSPDGTKLAFTGDRDWNLEIFVMNADGSDPVRLTRHGDTDTHPTWSPDGTKIAWANDRGEYGYERGIYVMNADGSKKTDLTPGTRGGDYPSWSPDGTKIAFLGGNRLHWPSGLHLTDIYSMSPDGSDATNLTEDYAVSWEGPVSWSPDGTRIVAVGRAAEEWEEDPACSHFSACMYVMKADGSGLATLSNDIYVYPAPVWSPDGTKIAFPSARGSGDDLSIYVMSADGSEVTRLTRGHFDGEPDWQPLPVPTSKADCWDGGYKEFSFKNQGECVASLQMAAK